MACVVCLISNLALKVFLPNALQYFLHATCTLLSKQSSMWIYSSLLFCLTMLKLQDAVLCQCATETMHEIYWPQVLPFDTQDVAYAISHLLRLPCKADLSSLQAIFKLWAPETYGAMGNFIINALHLSGLIQARRRSCKSMSYICTVLRQTRAPVTNPTINSLAGGDAWWSIPLNYTRL